MDSNNGRNATQADAGWRANEQPANVRQATQADAGWRANEPAANARQATQADAGWRANEPAANVRQATQADAGWRANEPETNARQATQADAGWRANEPAANARQATQADAGWRNAAQGNDATSIMNQATGNVFSTIETFQDAVSKLPELVSSNNNVYAVKGVISKAGGESVILLCAAPDGTDVVAKVYYEQVNSAGSSASARSLVLDYMSTDAGKEYTLAVSEIGLVQFEGGSYYFEIMPYCKEGDLSKEPPMSFNEIVALTERLNEALHSMHEAGILHRDIKPENIYHHNGKILIGDFGVAKLVKGGATRHTAGTDGYRAPESVLAVTAGDTTFFFDEKCDYYSLGVTLGSLFEGHFVYEGMDSVAITNAVRKGKLPLLRVDPKRELLENLLVGLCRYDSAHRFGYEDVKRWLADPYYTGGSMDGEWDKPFRMKNVERKINDEYFDEKSLFEGITKDRDHWEEGKELLYGEYLAQFFKSFRPEIARAAEKAVETYKKSQDKGLSVFLKELYAPGPMVWQGYTFKSLQELAGRMVIAQKPKGYGNMLRRNVVSHWLLYTEGIAKNAQNDAIVAQMEKLAVDSPEIACYWYGNSFAAQRQLSIYGKKVSTIQELIDTLFSSPRDFYTAGGYDKLMSMTEGADLYGFLYSFGYKDFIEKEWDAANRCDDYNKACDLFAMLDTIAVKEKANPNILRQFFVNYGPIGGAVFTQKLINGFKEEVYVGFDYEGKQIISSIKDFKADLNKDVKGIFQDHIRLVENVEKLQKSVIDNPFCVTTGVYNCRGTICTNLIGSFAFSMYGKKAPLGYQAWINSAKGGK